MEPVEALVDRIERVDPTAICLSCPMARSLPGVAARAAVIADATTCPILAGGAGMGDDPTRANAIGARWESSILDVHETLLAADGGLSTPPPPQPSSDHVRLHGRRSELRSVLECPSLNSITGSIFAEHILDTLTAATIVDDHRLASQEIEWIARVVNARQESFDPVKDRLERLQPHVADLPSPSAALSSALATCRRMT
jgi:hypothetical protein